MQENRNLNRAVLQSELITKGPGVGRTTEAMMQGHNTNIKTTFDTAKTEARSLTKRDNADSSNRWYFNYPANEDSV